MNRIFTYATLIATLFFFWPPQTSHAFTEDDESYYSQGKKIAFGGLSLQHLGIHLAFDYGLHDLISVGASTGYNRESELIKNINYLPILGRVAFHPLNLTFFSDMFTFVNNVDIYLGANGGWMFGWESLKEGITSTQNTSNISRYTIGILAGIHLNTSEKWGFYVEHCGEASQIVIGATYKL